MTENTYKLIDSGYFQKLEQVGPYRFVRPSAQAVWKPRLPTPEWQCDASFERFSGGDGKWTFHTKIPDTWVIDVGHISLNIKLTDFGHLGIFPEQAPNWDKIHDLCKKASSDREIRVINMFAYTGGSTLAAASGGAHAVHLDASKTSVAWARENAESSGLGDKPVRWIVDDVNKFVAREVKRGNTYHGIILDPPSFGRGAKGESWKIEEDLPKLMDELRKILDKDFLFVLLSAHSQGYTPMALENLLLDFNDGKGTLDSEEMVVRETNANRPLPSGNSCFLINE